MQRHGMDSRGGGGGGTWKAEKEVCSTYACRGLLHRIGDSFGVRRRHRAHGSDDRGGRIRRSLHSGTERSACSGKRRADETKVDHICK